MIEQKGSQRAIQLSVDMFLDNMSISVSFYATYLERELANSWHVGWLREGVKSWNTRRKRVKFSPDLSGVNFFEMLPPDYRDSPKTSRYFEKIDLSDSKLVSSDLSNLNFYKANFNNANLSAADMSRSNFSAAKFTNTNLAGAVAQSSIFNDAEFDQAVLLNVSFKETEAKNAVFIATELSESQHESLGAQIKTYASHSNFDAVKWQVVQTDNRSKSTPRSESKDDRRTKKNRYDVFFGTNRQPTIQMGQVVDYGAARSSELHFGLCQVILPERRPVGSLGSPGWRRLFNLADDGLHIKSLITLDQTLFFEAWNQTTHRLKAKAKPTIFVHGYNNSFEDAVKKAAQIGRDLGLGQGIGLFSWPSKNTLLGYSADVATIDVSKYFLADFIEAFVKNVPQQSVNLIAHSMGCRCLLGAFDELAKDRREILDAIDQTILAAADVDTGLMSRLGRYVVDFPTRSTSYVSTKDIALKISSLVHNYDRVGVSPPTYVLNGMDTIKVNELDMNNFISHDYMSTSRTVLNDIHSLIKNNTPPSERFSMEEVVEDGNAFWRIRN